MRNGRRRSRREALGAILARVFVGDHRLPQSTIYAQNVTSTHVTDFHDITGGTSGSSSAVTGYDLVTGRGSPNGSGHIHALAGSAVPGFSLSASPTSVSVVQGESGASAITTTVSGGFNSAIALFASGQPTCVTVSFNPTSIAAPVSGTSTKTTGCGGRGPPNCRCPWAPPARRHEVQRRALQRRNQLFVRLGESRGQVELRDLPVRLQNAILRSVHQPHIVVGPRLQIVDLAGVERARVDVECNQRCIVQGAGAAGALLA